MSEELTFETAYERLQHIIGILEQNDIPLEESVTLYKDGAKLLQYCEHKLANATLLVEEILPNMEAVEVQNELL